MEERNENLVEVTTSTDRIYRAQDADKVAITVKAGVPTKVPHWVAKVWNLLKSEATAAKVEPPKPEAASTGKKAH